MKIEIRPSKLSGRIKAPPSKSMAHRLLICAALCEGESIISNINYCDDILATLDCLRSLGAVIRSKGDCISITGTNPYMSKGTVFPCRESGSTLRFLMPVAMLSGEKSRFTAQGRLSERPMLVYESLAAEKGLFYEKNSDGIDVCGELKGGEYRIRGDISSQFISGLMFALPLCNCDSRIIIEGKTESLPYIEMTVYVLGLFGVSIKKEADNSYFIKGGQKYIPGNHTVEGDYSGSAVLEAFNCVSSQIEIVGLDEESLQGDRVYREYFSMLRDSAPVIDISDSPDLAPILMTLAAFFCGATLTGTNRLRYKESDRAEAMKSELLKFGAEIDIGDDRIIIYKSRLHTPSDTLCGHNDHRIVMSLAVLASRYGGLIEGAEATDKSFPDFFMKMKKLGLQISEGEN